MSAFVPSSDDDVFAKVREDKHREAADGFDGSWVAHPGLVKVCREEFDAVLGEKPHRIDRLRGDVHVLKHDLLNFAAAGSEVTEEGLRSNSAVAVRYMDTWLEGSRAVAINYGRYLTEEPVVAEAA